MKMKRKLRKFLLMLSSAILLVSISVGATVAYLTDTEAVTNTFTVGQVGLSLDEADTDNSTADADRDHENEYHLVPGEQYEKDPTVHVDANSEDCWVFVKIENGLADIEGPATYATGENTTATGTIAEQAVALGWTKLTGVEDVDNVYYRKYVKAKTVTDYVVFKNFKIDGDKAVNTTELENGEYLLDNYANATIDVTAYAIQMAGFENDPAAAWKTGVSQWE